MPIFYFAWVNENITFNPAVHATVTTKIWDGVEGEEEVFQFEIEHSEGEFPSLSAEVRNPRVGLLTVGRQQWVWLSQDTGAGAEPLFYGRIIGIPEQLANEVVRLQFVARPTDYVAQKEALADALRVLPWFDRLWLQDSVDDPDTVLETYTARWHIDRTTLEVTTSDIIDGEDGTLEIGEADHLYDDIDVSYAETPLRRVKITGTVTWDQKGIGEIDLTRRLVSAFQAAGSPYESPLIASLTGPGLFEDWPQPLAEIAGGWTYAATSTIELATWMQEQAYVVHYGDRNQDFMDPFRPDWQVTPSELVFGAFEFPQTVTFPSSPPQSLNEPNSEEDPFGNWEFAALLTALKPNLVVRWEADRQRSEIVTTTLEADVQALLVDPGADETDTIELTSDLVDDAIDPDAGSPGAFDLPIGDTRRNSYFKTDRGQQSFEYLLLLARAKLLSRARAVEITIAGLWSQLALVISCRYNVHLVDYRLPGGEATGKVTSYKLTCDGENGDLDASVTLSCTIGYGVPLGAAAAGTPMYVDDGYVDDPYQTRTGAEVSLIAGELNYQSFDDFEVEDDDGLDLFNMTATTAVNSLTVTGGPTAQRAAIDAAAALPPTAAPDPQQALDDTPTEVCLDLVPVQGGPFKVTYEPEISLLVVPQTINLEIAA